MREEVVWMLYTEEDGEGKSVEWCPVAEEVLREDVAELERRLAHLGGRERCVCAENPKKALYAALLAAEIKPGDQVLCSALLPGELREALDLAGAELVLVDINPNTYNIDPYCLKYAIGRCLRTSQPLPKLLIASDMFGLPCDYNQIEEICTTHCITLVEDATASLGGKVGERPAGSFGRFAVTAYPSGADDRPVGAVLCRSRADERALRGLLDGMDWDGGADMADGVGRMTVCATMALARLREFDRHRAARQAVAEYYALRLEGDYRIQNIPEGFESARTSFVLALPEAARRSPVASALYKKGIPCAVFDPVLRGLQQSAEWGELRTANSRDIAGRLLSLPIHPYLSKHLADFIIAQVNKEILAAGQPVMQS